MSKADRDAERAMLLSGIPKTLSMRKIVENADILDRIDQKRRARNSSKVNLAALQPNEAASLPGQDTEPLTRRERERERQDAMVRASQNVPDPTPSRVDLTRDDLPGFMRLEVTEIEGYAGNPRIFRNDKAPEIRESLKQQGFTGSMTVTRRGKGQPYILAAGSNTTLQLLKDLYAETGNERYRYVSCVYQDFEDETQLLVQHLGENVNRGDMRFWEVAKAMLEVAKQLEDKEIAAGKRTKPMSSRDIAEALTAVGLKAERSMVQVWQFAVTRLGMFGEHTSVLTARGVRHTIQPRLNALRHLSGLFGVAEDEFWTGLVPSALSRVSQAIVAQEGEPSLDHAQIPDTVHSLLAERVGETSASLRDLLAGLARNPSASLQDLRAPDPSAFVGRMGDGAGASARLEGDADESEPGPVHEDPPPEGAATQVHLPLGPTVIRDQARSPGGAATLPTAPCGAAASAGAESPHPAPEPAPPGGGLAMPPASPRQTPLPLPFGAVEGDPLPALHAALVELLTAAQLIDLLRWWEPLPLGFFLDMPEPGQHKRVMVEMDSPGDLLRQTKTLVYWTLVKLSGQYTNSSPDYLDKTCRFYLANAALNDSSTDPFAGTDMAQELQDQELLMRRIWPGPYRHVLHQLRLVESLMSEVYQAYPERWQLMVRLEASNSPY